MSVSYLALSLDIDSEGRLRKTLYYAKLILSIPFQLLMYQSSKIPSVQAYRLCISCISQLIHSSSIM